MIYHSKNLKQHFKLSANYYRVNNNLQKSTDMIGGYYKTLSHNLSSGVLIEFTGRNPPSVAGTITVEGIIIRKIE